MTDIHITDLANPVFTDIQKTILASGDSIDVNFDRDALLQEAREATGLSDFGDDEYLERLDLLCDEWGNDAGLSGIGRLTMRSRLLKYCKNRLLIEDLLARHPEIHDIEIKQPIIVAGLPRTGTTHLLNLLAADTRLRAMPLWESMEPVPTPGEGLLDDGTDPRFQRCQDEWDMMQASVPYLAAMHPMNPEHINEEIELMLPNFSSYCFEWFTHSPRFRDHYLAMDQLPHYEYMKTGLKILQFLQPEHYPTRWVLKSPMHLENLPELQQVFPDATYVITHRDPVSVIQSTLTMIAYGQRMNRKRVLIDELADYWVERIHHMLKRCAQTYAQLPTQQTIDVPFRDFMADDMAMVARIYATAGLDLSEQARGEMEAFIKAHPRTKGGQVIYNLRGDFGLEPDALREQFAFYFEQFPVTPDKI